MAGLGAVMAAFALPAAASADCTIPSGPPRDPIDNSFDGPVQDFNGNFDAAKQGSYVQIPFNVPQGTTAIRVRYCYDQPPTSGPSNTLDIGVYEPVSDTVYGPAEQRGWSGSAVKDLAISENGYSPPAVYGTTDDTRKAFVHGYTTRAYQAGPMPAGTWAAELGLASIVGPPNDPDGVDWRVRVETSTDGSWSDDPYSSVPYNDTAAAPGPGWYSGDVHVHGEEEPGNSLMSTSFNFAFAPLSAGGAGLDFVGLVDHNNNINRGEIGRYQGDYPGKLIIPGTEVTTYKGHYNNLGSSTFADFRGGPIYQRKSNGDLEKVTDGIAPASQFGPIQASGGWTQINHPTVIGGSVVPRLPVGLHGRRDRLLEGRRDRGPKRRGRLRPAPERDPEPVHGERDRLLRARARDGRPHRRGRLERRPQDQRARRGDRPGDHGRRRDRPLARRDRPGHPRRPHLREALRQRRPGHPVTARAPGDTNRTLGDTLTGPEARFRRPGAARGRRRGAPGEL